VQLDPAAANIALLRNRGKLNRGKAIALKNVSRTENPAHERSEKSAFL
jgi:hypothetical protein